MLFKLTNAFTMTITSYLIIVDHSPIPAQGQCALTLYDIERSHTQ